MGQTSGGQTQGETRSGTQSETQSIHVRYWAAAKAAAGVAGDDLVVSGPLTLAQVRERVLALHPHSRLGDVLPICSVLVGDRPVGTQSPADVQVPAGTSVEFLPPFAGG